MHNLTYSSFINDIKNFNDETYLNNSKNILDLFNNFIQLYKNIEENDLKKNNFILNNKKKNNYNFKNLKISKNENNSWVYKDPTEFIEKISILIKSYLNKITQDTYSIISNEFINELSNYDDIKIFDILSEEILNKCLFDNKYRNLYINLCSKIWSNKQLHYNLIDIIKDQKNNFSWSLKNNNNVNSIKSFSNEINTKNDAFNKLNFKVIFINYIQNKYNNIDLNFDDLNEEEIFLKKKKILLLFELISILYVEKFINFNIINLIIIDLLHVKNFNEIKDVEFESLYTLLKNIKEFKKNFKDLNEYNLIFDQFKNILLKIDINNYTKRSIFFINEIIGTLNYFTNNKENSNVIKKEENTDSLNNFLINLKNKNYTENLNLYKTFNFENKKNIIKKSLELFLENNNNNILNFLIAIDEKKDLNNIILKIIENIEDIILDIPNANQILINLINKINIEQKEDLIEKLNSINDSDSDED